MKSIFQWWIKYVNVYHLTGTDLLCGLYWSLKAWPADVNILSVAVLGQEFKKGAHVQVVIVVNVTEPPVIEETEGWKMLK